MLGNSDRLYSKNEKNNKYIKFSLDYLGISCYNIITIYYIL